MHQRLREAKTAVEAVLEAFLSERRRLILARPADLEPLVGAAEALRGRHGRTWISGPDAGLYFSIVLRPTIEREQLGLITLMAGVAVHDTLKEFGMSPDIKWVNDVLVNDKKITVILAEAVETPTGLAVVLGIGINVKSSPVLDTATSIEAELSEPGAVATGFLQGSTVSMQMVEQSLIDRLVDWYKQLASSPNAMIDEWRRRSSYYCGKSDRVTVSGDAIEGTTDGLEANGALRVKLAVRFLLFRRVTSNG